MKLYSHLQPKDAKFIITLANKGFSFYKITKITGINKDKIRRNLNKCKIKTKADNLSQPWKDPHIKIRYSFKSWRLMRHLGKTNRAYAYAKNA